MDKAFVQSGKILIQRLIALLCFAFGAHFSLREVDWIFFGILFGSTVGSLVYLNIKAASTLQGREESASDSPPSDFIILAIYYILHFILIFYLAGVEVGPSPQMGSYFGGVFLGVASSVLSTWALSVNPFLYPTVRVGEEQVVIKDGPYRFIRHPAYSSSILSAVSLVLIFQTPLVGATAALIAVILLGRSVLEDRYLSANLAGYEAYRQEVRYRLIPYFW